MSEFKMRKESYRSFKYADLEPGEEVVVSGLAGRFPESDNVEELKDNLFNANDCITDDERRWKQDDHPEIPRRTGKVKNIEKFDASFFGINLEQADSMDPMGRMLLEHAYEAILDAGMNPKDVRGTRTGVFVGSCFSESEKIWLYEKFEENGFGITGYSRDLLANRISFWLGVTGPSCVVDSACSSSIYALEHAYKAIRSGQCDYAIVGGSNLCLHPSLSLHFSRLGALAQDGRSRCLDEDAAGYVRSEAVAVVFLQRAKGAKRIYATVVHVKTNCDGYKEEGIMFPSRKMQSILFEEFYKECGVPITSVSYVEAHGTGTRVGDLVEMNAINQIFTKGRTNPLKVGTIKSNIGHTEAASGISSLIKAIISMESGQIPPNINFNRPRKDVKGFTEGRIEVVERTTPLDGEYIGINSFGIGGADAHVLLKSNPKSKIDGRFPRDYLPRLVAVSGRTEEAVITILNDIDNRSVDVEFIRLLHDVHLKGISNHSYRGYTITGLKSFNRRIREIENCSDTKKPIWFVFSGMDLRCFETGRALMRFPIFAKAMEKCDTVLKPRGLDINGILTKSDNGMSDILRLFVGTAAIQIGLIDLLTAVGVIPDYVIGYSFGELGCAYADECFTAEEMILAAYSRGMALTETKIPCCSTATVGLGYKYMKDLCPVDIDVVCHNGPECTTITGPVEVMKLFVEKLQAKKILVKDISRNNIPCHSRYIASAGTKLLAYLKKVIPVAKPRSQKWLSTSVPRNEWSTNIAQFSSAEYHTNNLLKPVLFEEILNLIPDDGVTIEIAPQDLLREILRESLRPTIRNIALTRRDHEDNVEVFLQGLGKLYNVGLQLDLAKLYPPVEYPVSRDTPMISPIIRWEHSHDWFVTSYKRDEKIVSGERTIAISITNEDFEYISGHMVNDKIIFPATGYLCLVWETFGMTIGQSYTDISVVIKNVKFDRSTIIPKKGKVEIIVVIQKGSGKFEVIESDVAIVTGTIRLATNLSKERVSIDVIDKNINNEREELNDTDIYKELKLRGYQYNGLFRSMRSAAISRNKGHIEWKNNWIVFMDNILQMKIFNLDSKGLHVPIGIRKLIIDTNAHKQYLRSLTSNNKRCVPIQLLKYVDVIIAGGVEIHNVRLSSIPRKIPISDPLLEEYKFTPYRDNVEVSLREILTLSVLIILENIPMIKMRTIEFVGDDDDISAKKLVSPLLLDILSNLSLIVANVNVLVATNKFAEEDIPKDVKVLKSKDIRRNDNAPFAIGYGLLTEERKDNLIRLLRFTKDGAFILLREKTNTPLDFSLLNEFQLRIILEKRTSEEAWILLRKINNKIPKNTSFININSNEFSWLQQVQTILANEGERNIDNTRVILVEEGNFESGLLGFINCLRKEPDGEIFRAVLIQDLEAPKFSLELPLYSEQLEKDLVINVLQPGKVWGSYRHQLLPPFEPKPTYHALINQSLPGNLNSLRWVEGPITKEYQKDDLVNIHYASLNFKDVMLAMGKIAQDVVKDRKELDCVLGFEYSGIGTDGRRIMGLNRARCLSNFCQLDDTFSWTVPESWSLEDAATVPSVYCTCIAALYISAQMTKDDKILIHAGAGGVGQAAINLALREGCEVFTTVGTAKKREFIRKTFPSIDDDHIGNSRDTSFEKMILQQTDGAGVDIVLNSLTEEKLLVSLRCLARGGRFVEIGKFYLIADNQLTMKTFKKGISYHSVMLDKVMSTRDDVKNEISLRLKRLIEENAIKPIVRTIFDKDKVETAFRYMAAGKHIGKVLIKIREENEEPSNAPILAEPSYMCLPNKSYIVLGGLGGFGLEIIDWLVLRNAQNIVITSRNGVKNGYQRMRIKLWESYGVNIKILVGLNASKREDCELIIKTATDEGSVDGIFNLAVSLRDGIFRNQTSETFEKPFRGKAWSTKCLDEVTRKLCPELRHFVVFSSVSCGKGNPGQTNYGMANSIMERICEQRVKEGLPGLAIQWGAIGDVGIVADMQNDDKQLNIIGGTLKQTITSCLKKLNRFLLLDKPIVSCMLVANKQADSGDANNIVDTVLNIMGIKDLNIVNQHTSLAELGMDSMTAVEIKQTLNREYEICLTLQDIRSLNLAKLMKMNNKLIYNSNQNESAVKKTKY